MCQVMMPAAMRKIPPTMRSSALTSPIHPAWFPKKASIVYGERPVFSLKEAAIGVTGTFAPERRESIEPEAPPTRAVLAAESIVAPDTVSTAEYSLMKVLTSDARTALMRSW